MRDILNVIFFNIYRCLLILKKMGKPLYYNQEFPETYQDISSLHGGALSALPDFF